LEKLDIKNADVVLNKAVAKEIAKAVIDFC